MARSSCQRSAVRRPGHCLPPSTKYRASVCRYLIPRQWWINRHPHAHTRDTLEGPPEGVLGLPGGRALNERPSCSGSASMRQSFRSALIASVIASASMFISRCVSSVSGLRYGPCARDQPDRPTSVPASVETGNGDRRPCLTSLFGSRFSCFLFEFVVDSVGPSLPAQDVLDRCWSDAVGFSDSGSGHTEQTHPDDSGGIPTIELPSVSLAPRPARIISSMLSFCVPARRCSGLTHSGLWHVWRISCPVGIGPCAHS